MPKGMLDFVLKAIALAMGIACVVLGILHAASIETTVTLLSIGFLALAFAEFQKARLG